MAEPSERPLPAQPRPVRKPRILWAALCCLLDGSSGASMSVREMLRQLAGNGYEITVVGATNFDDPSGVPRPLKEQWLELKKNKKPAINVNDGPLTHRLLITESTQREAMRCDEENLWHDLYTHVLDASKPDLVFFFGGLPLDLVIGDEAGARGIPVAAYIGNGNYHGTRWCRDVDLIITDSRATAKLYEERYGYRMVPVGKFVDPATKRATRHSRERVLFVNPSLEKGAGIVIALAMLLEERRPDIKFEVVESRGNWHELVREVTRVRGSPRESLKNVIVTPNTGDMRPIYGRARVVLMPSLWWESGGRVLVEAMMNGIPAFITDRGGMPEMVENAGIKINFSEEFFKPPYLRVPSPESLAPIVDLIIRMYDDKAFYDGCVARAFKVGQTQHSLETSTKRLIEAIAPLIEKRAGDGDFSSLQKQAHKQGLEPASHVTEKKERPQRQTSG